MRRVPPEVLGDASARDPRDASRRACEWCGRPFPPGTRADAEVCPRAVDPYGKCRKARWRFRRGAQGTRPADRRDASRADRPLRLAYADPPYPGKAGLYPEDSEVDHGELLERLVGYDGWALSTSAEALPAVLRLCPPTVRVAAWRRRVRSVRSARPLSAWEPVILDGGRPLQTDRAQDVLDVLDYRGRYDAYPGALVGMKPPEFAAWIFDMLGARPGDGLDDLFPGSGAVARAWRMRCAPAAGGQPGREGEASRGA